MKYLLSLLAGMLLLAEVSFANNYAYIYIEGDKQTPFYVKMEGQMVPRLGKNYCIISNLDAGVTNIEVLFQQNKYPAQKFAVKVPAGGNRGFLLQKVNDRQFALYDIQQGTHLLAGNKPEDDQLLSAAAISSLAASKETATPGTSEESIPEFVAERKPKKTKVEKEPKVAVEPVKKEESRFIEDIELNNGAGTKASSEIPAYKPRPIAKKKTKKQNEERTLAASTNNDDDIPEPPKKEEVAVKETEPSSTAANDCKDNITTEDFEDFAMKILDKTEDDEKIKVLKKGKGKKCFTTEQVRIIANNLETQSGRYDVVNLLYAQTSDKENYSKLESLFKTNYLKGKFKEILNQ